MRVSVPLSGSRRVLMAAIAIAIAIVVAIATGCTLARGVDGISGGNCRADGVKNGVETDVDCGRGCGPCAEGRACATDSDCASGVCSDTFEGRRCTSACLNLTDEFECSPTCTARDVCVKRGKGAPVCEPLAASCPRDSLVDCREAYCGSQSSGASSTEGHLHCFGVEACP